jgi:hypothetical protein
MDGPAPLFWEWHPCAAKPRPPIGASAHASFFGETLVTHRAVPRPALFLASTLDLGILNPTKEPGRKESPLAATNVNPFPAKHPGVYRPYTWSEHYQAYLERGEQNVHARCGPPSSMIACKPPTTGVHNPGSGKLPTPIAMNPAKSPSCGAPQSPKQPSPLSAVPVPAGSYSPDKSRT